jgi:hypothetical protein
MLSRSFVQLQTFNSVAGLGVGIAPLFVLMRMRTATSIIASVDAHGEARPWDKRAHPMASTFSVSLSKHWPDRGRLIRR